MNFDDIVYLSGAIITFLVLSFCSYKYKPQIAKHMGVIKMDAPMCFLLSIVCFGFSVVWFVTIPLAILTLIFYFKKEKEIE